MTGATGEKRRIPRVPVRRPVAVCERYAAWCTATEDVGARGCRIALVRPLVPGALVELRFDRGAGEPAIEVVGQVVWAQNGAPHAAGIAFVGAPHDRAGRTAALLPRRG